MVKVRQDAWSHEDDLLLAETVLRHIREGSTQLNAFEEVGDKLNRTSAACGFRWNAEVRTKYDNAIDLAKRQRKEKKRALAGHSTRVIKPVAQITAPSTESDYQPLEQTPSVVENAPITMDTVIRFLKDVKKDYYASNQSKASLAQMQQENTKLKEEVKELSQQLKQTESQLATVQEDYQVFIQIMDRARKMTVLEESGVSSSPTFRMDKNGNLQQLAQGN
ncbi:RsfA family transcriptional regulator [Oceanobacillus manasiensis]|uniref:RsfA family transcriptional regulator n=1 Tax=Oceanobacillus manasiensis TaxID=586413 RepID=UPI0005AA2341|nr:RsfA family transcriptional regulator [Oceanobacillus manasiensis]